MDLNVYFLEGKTLVSIKTMRVLFSVCESKCKKGLNLMIIQNWCKLTMSPCGSSSRKHQFYDRTPKQTEISIHCYMNRWCA